MGPINSVRRGENDRSRAAPEARNRYESKRAERSDEPRENHSAARGTEPADWAGVVERAERGKGPPRVINGAGNGIRTRDFDLGKVALYH